MTCISFTSYIAAAVKQNAAIIAAGAADIAIQAGVALWQRNSSKSISNMQKDIANQQMAMAEEVQAHAALYYPREAALVNDAFGEAKVVTGYVSLAAEFGGLVASSLESGRQDWLQTMDDACMSPDLCDDSRWQRNAQLAVSDMLSYAARKDESRTQIINDRRYGRQMTVLGLGNGQLRDMLGYQDIAQAGSVESSELLLGTVNSMRNALGYLPVREAPRSGWGSGIVQAWGIARSSITGAPPVLVSQRPQVERERLNPVRFEPEPITVQSTRITKENDVSMAPDIEAMRAEMRRGER